MYLKIIQHLEDDCHETTTFLLIETLNASNVIDVGNVYLSIAQATGSYMHK